MQLFLSLNHITFPPKINNEGFRLENKHEREISSPKKILVGRCKKLLALAEVRIYDCPIRER